MIVLISGKQGSGKTTLANKLCEKARMSRVYAYQTGSRKAIDTVINGISICAKGQGCPVPENINDKELIDLIHIWGKNHDDYFWAHAVRKDILNVQELWKTQPFYLIAVDDIKCKPEMEAFDDLDAVFRVRLESPYSCRRTRVGEWGDPDTLLETDLDDYNNFDLTLNTQDFCADTNAAKVYETIMGIMRERNGKA